MATHPQIRLLEHADVIGVDQRGTGASLPDLTRGETIEILPASRPVGRAEMIAALDTAVRGTVERWRETGVDLTAYNTRQSADDLEAVRRLIGAEKIVIYGSSYGSHLGLAYLRRHGEHVSRAVLSRVEGPNHTWKLPSTVQRQLELVDALGSGDPETTGILTTIRELLTRLDAVPAQAGGVTLGALDLQIAVSRRLDSIDTIAALPAMLARLEAGDWSELAEEAKENRRVGVHAMALMMDCASGATAERRLRIERERRDPANLLGDALLAPFYPEACLAAGAPDLGDGFRGPVEGELPVLFVSGTLDVRTPPENVEEIRAGFPDGVHVEVENAGHPSRELMSREFRDLLQAFLRGETVRDCRIELPEPMFERFSGD